MVIQESIRCLFWEQKKNCKRDAVLLDIKGCVHIVTTALRRAQSRLMFCPLRM
jgi:hypothetical protein